MTIKKAVSIFQNENPGRKIQGYWIDGSDVILNVDPTMPGAPEPCQFCILENGSIIPTNPVKHNILLTKAMHNL